MKETDDNERIKVAVVDNSKYRAIIAPEELSLMRLVRRHATYVKDVKECIELVIERTHVCLSSEFETQFFGPFRLSDRLIKNILLEKLHRSNSGLQRKVRNRR